MSKKPLVAITVGDPNGIGPEIAVKALEDKRVQDAVTPILIGDKSALLEQGFKEGTCMVVNTSAKTCRAKQAIAGPSAEGGLSSFEAVAMAARLVSKGEVKAMITGPVSKESWHMAGINFTGHTEFLKHFAKVDNVLMMFVSGKLTVGLVSEHFAIRDLHKEITPKRIIRATELLSKYLKQFKKNPLIGVAAINPHAGDGGKLGYEEIEIIKPAVAVLKKEGINVQGPLPVDSLWQKHAKGAFDGIICMYHDQAMLGLKLAAKEPIVHITYGLPFMRTSPTHGTAFDIAGNHEADPASMIAAILKAADK
ncbi:4-hydroxythreonine-4-phosphate dehydrogenase [Elusimicrobium posterum]|uniref:4-hydroxythreonine-4-phosphate dehydrogenase PdxA n=1 Tax=Elusimicrobium posterum TaxID=3116653 RepID=UPI003C7904B1